MLTAVPVNQRSGFWWSPTGRRLLISAVVLSLLAALLATSVEIYGESGVTASRAATILAGETARTVLFALLVLALVDRLALHRSPPAPKPVVPMGQGAGMAAILDNIPDLAWVKDAEGRYLVVNRSLARVLGAASPEEMVGKTDFDYSPSEIAEGYRRGDIEVMRSGEPIRTEETHARADGGSFLIETIKTPLRDADGTIVGTVGIARDVTEHKRVEEQLRRTASSMETVVANLPGTVFRMHYPAQGIKRMARWDGSPPYAAIADPTILSPEEYPQLFHPDDREWLFVELPRLFRTTDYVTHLFRVKVADDSYRWRRAWERVIERSGDEFFTEGITLDVTEEVVAKLALEKSEQEFRTLVENSPNIIMRYDREGRRIYVNPAYERATAISRDEALNVTPDGQWINVDPPIEVYREKLRSVMETGEPAQIVVTWTRRIDGRAIAHDVHLVADRDPQGMIVGVLAIGHDITLLRRTERQLKALIDNLPGRTYRITILPSGECRMEFTGGSGLDLPESVTGVEHRLGPGHLGPHVHPDDMDRVNREAMEQVAEKGSFEVRYRLALPDDATHWVMSRGKVVKEADDMRVIEGMMLDVTSEMVAKHALEASERRFRELVDALPVGVFEDEPGKGCVYASGLWSRLTGLPIEKIKGTGWVDALHPDDFDRVVEVWTRDTTAHAFHQNEFRLRHVDGTVRWVLVRALPRLDPDGRLRGYIGSVTDISERKQMEVALKSSEESFRTLAENLPDMVVRMDCEGRFIYATPQVCRIDGHPLDYILGKTVAELSPPGWREHGEALLASIRRVAAEGVPHTMDVCWETPDGQLYSTITHVPERNEAGEVISVLGISRDVTAQKTVEEELRRTAVRLKTLIDNLPGSVFRMRYPATGLKELVMLEGSVARETPEVVEALLSMSPEEYRDGFDEVQRQFLYQDLPTLLRDQGEAEFVLWVTDEHGRRQCLRTWERVVERDGDAFFTEGIALDVTAEMEAKQSFEKSERHFRDLVEALPVGVFEDDLVTGCVFTSRVWWELTGLSSDDVRGDGWQRALVEKDSPRVLDAWRNAVAGRAVFEAEFRLRNAKTSHETWVLARALPRMDTEGRLEGYIGSITDIGDRKAYEAWLETINRTLRAVAAANEALVLEADEEAVFARVCAALVEVGGYAMAWVGIADQDEHKSVRPVASAGDDHDYIVTARVRWDDSPRGRGPTGTAIRTGQPQANNDMAVNPNMSPWRVKALTCGYRSNAALPLKAEGAVIGCLTIYAGEVNGFSDEVLAIMADLATNVAVTVLAIRERRRREEIEKHLVQAQKMEALGLLASSVAHDFNNLLGAIQGFARFIVEDAQPDGKTAYHGQRILMAGRRGRALIGQILSFSRQMEMKRERFSLGDMLNDVGTLVRTTLPASTQLGIDPVSIPCVVNGDRELLGQALINLCANASDALGGSPGTISLRLRLLRQDEVEARLSSPSPPPGELRAWEEEGGVVRAVSGTVEASVPCVSLQVSDPGCGMDLATLERIFIPFFTTKEKGQGTGLGLAAVQRIAAAHHGAVAVESRRGKGTTFEVILPTENLEDQAEESVLPARRDVKVSGIRILLVDDDPDFGDMLLTALERRGFEVSPCTTPLEAIEGLREFPEAWDAMVTDQTMPDMTGLELIRLARALQPKLPCILCSGYADDALTEAALADAGADAMFRKPIDIDALTNRLAAVVNNE